MIVIDNFLTDEKAIKSLCYSKFWEDKSYYFRNFESGFDNTVGSYIVARIMEEPDLMNKYPFNLACGYEYWPTVLLPGIEEIGEDGDYYSLPVHSDYDINEYVQTETLNYPLFGAVLYLGNQKVFGGVLRIWEDDNEYKEVEPIHNRLVVFDSSKKHGVTKITRGIRRSIAINFWQKPIKLTEE